MKVRLNLTIDQDVLAATKEEVSKSKTSISELVESFLKRITISKNRNTVIDIVQSLPKPPDMVERDLEKAYKEERAEKYGF